ncbi:uncharacterized protein HD556DRAFT_1304313 [Suillus plorans]|uniref:Uncharacterized protein n=1 Tax=Suillus plorans TaxID=116603 RepID=A0A9P7J426_9AGAM|nr:uncharacterized protein HD556DRAFT_1304313 [Suillus plorans]KAG1802135.1 hypothetical protein HD556DRAFT_1304313 [Suillus plorans]
MHQEAIQGKLWPLKYSARERKFSYFYGTDLHVSMEVMPLTCAVKPSSNVILLYSLTRFCASKNEPKGCPSDSATDELPGNLSQWSIKARFNLISQPPEDTDPTANQESDRVVLGPPFDHPIGSLILPQVVDLNWRHAQQLGNAGVYSVAFENALVPSQLTIDASIVMKYGMHACIHAENVKRLGGMVISLASGCIS